MSNLLAISPADAHALTMVAILAFALGSLVTMFFIMARNGRKNEELDLPEFPEEMTKKKPTQPSKPILKKGRKKDEGWEKEGDWWK